MSIDARGDFTPDFVKKIRDAHGDLANRPSPVDRNVHAPRSVLQVKSLHLVGFDFLDILRNGSPPLFGVENLSYLTLESCFFESGVLQLLSITGRASDSPWKPRLKGFTVRYEGDDLALEPAPEAFFEAFSGLTHLSVLLEGPGPSISPKCVVKNHGSTLQTLVWDQRKTARTDLAAITNSSSESALFRATGLIASGCPELRELGVVMCPRADGSRHSYIVRMILLQRRNLG